MTKTPLRIVVDDAVALEAEWDEPDDPRVAVVFCHPNPLDGGTMRAPLMRAVTEGLVDYGAAVLRFNFRGVGTSTGDHGRGLPEVQDVAAAVAAAGERHGHLSNAVIGWSFGAVTSLRWQAQSGSTMLYVGIAPPVVNDGIPILPAAGDLLPAQRSFVLGDRDQFVTVDELQGYAEDIGATLTVLKGSDHFFYFREQRVVEVIATALELIHTPQTPLT